MYVLPAYMLTAYGGQKRILDFLEPELWMIVSLHPWTVTDMHSPPQLIIK